jgi:hypothetical protein
VNEVEVIMVDRQLFGDLAFAVLLVLPTAALVQTQSADTANNQANNPVRPAVAATHAAASVHAWTDGRISLLG